jgi:hypothetical protein
MGPQVFTFVITKFVGDQFFGDSRCECYSKTKNFGIECEKHMSNQQVIL